MGVRENPLKDETLEQERAMSDEKWLLRRGKKGVNNGGEGCFGDFRFWRFCVDRWIGDTWRVGIV